MTIETRTCPVCGEELIKNNKKSEKSPDYICSDPDCKYSWVNGEWAPGKFRTGVWEKRTGKIVQIKDKSDGIKEMFKEKQENIKELSENKQNSIMASVALNNAVLLYQDEKIKDSILILNTANDFYNWLKRKYDQIEESTPPFRGNVFKKREIKSVVPKTFPLDENPAIDYPKEERDREYPEDVIEKENN